MTSEEFRKLALSLPAASEGAHMGHPDFRVAGKIFATLAYPKRGWGTIMLTRDEQEHFVRAQPAAFLPVKGGWGEKGATNVQLRTATKGIVCEALTFAWQKRAPRRLTRK
ncbi:MAG: MmcQ/YjbR family DNA-binding protein [Gemmatimonadetes bacterium]|nr:MmcQ/YjbR family DNA-binding protein [Gemmatimonadota bacterium]